MKNHTILSLSVALFLVACQPPEETSLEKLIEKKENFENSIDSINGLLIAINTEIGLLDTLKKSPLVASALVGRSEFNHYFKVQGNVESDKSATLFPETQGIVKAIYVKEGQQVSAGQNLLALDNDIIASNISEVETSLSLATEMFERQERLWNQNIGSEMQFIEAKSRKESMEKTIATLRKQQSMAVLKAPFSGVVDKIYPKIGEMGSPMSPAVSVVNLNELHAVADVSEKYLIKVKPNAPVRISFGEGMETLNGNIKNIGATINPANRTFEIKVGFAQKADFLRPNLMAEVEINDFKADSAIVIPSSNILQDIDGNSFVYCVMQEGSKHIAKKAIVNPGITYKGKTMILSGLNGGESIVTEGARKLVDGKEIRLN
jgi:membrane fusion protein (multidrug efflux system)